MPSKTLREVLVPRSPADPGWLRFQNALYADPRRHAVLAADLGVAPAELSNWKTARNRPPFSLLPHISGVLADGDPTFLARTMGILPDEIGMRRRLTRTFVALAELERRQAEVAETLRRVPDSGATALMAKAIGTGRWAGAVWPAFEGPPTCRLHVADRLDFTRVDGGETSEAALRADVGDLLDALHAVRTLGHRPQPRFASGADEGRDFEHWSIYRLHADRPPQTQALRLQQTMSVGVTSLSIRAWSSDVAAVLAMMLSWGLVSTRSLAATVRPQDLTERLEARGLALLDLLADPPHHHVWYHFGRLSDISIGHLPAANPWPAGLVMIRLRESDSMLRTASDGNEDFMDTLLAHRHRLDAEAQGYQGRLVTIDVDNPEDSDETSSPQERRDAKMARAVEVAGTALSELVERGWVSAAGLAGLHRVNLPGSEGSSECANVLTYLDSRGLKRW